MEPLQKTSADLDRCSDLANDEVAPPKIGRGRAIPTEYYAGRTGLILPS
jgi:hypothetical protein